MHKSSAIMMRWRSGMLAGLLLSLATAVALAADTTSDMRAIRVYGTELKLDRLPIPQPGEGQVRIRVYAAGINPFERPRVMTGPPPGADGMSAAPAGAPAAEGMGADASSPRQVGGDVAGVIEQLGAGVTGWKVGDAVTTAMQQAPQVDGAAQGSYSEFVISRASDIVAKSKKMTFEEAGGLPTVGLTAWRELMVRTQVKSGMRVLVLGASGGVGTAAVQIAKAQGAYVIGTGSTTAQDYLKAIGVDERIDYSKAQVADVVRNVDVVLNTVSTAVLVAALPSLRRGGVVVSVAGNVTEAQCTSAGVTCPAAVRPTAESVQPWLTEVTRLVDAGKYQTRVMRVLPLEQAAAAQALLGESGTRGKIVLSIHPDSATR